MSDDQRGAMMSDGSLDADRRMMKVVGTSALVCIALLVIAMIVAALGCRSTAPGEDATLVRAEQALVISFELADAFLRIEHSQPEAVAAAVPGAHALAEKIRAKGPAILTLAEEAISLYRSVRSEAARDEMLARVAQAEGLGGEAKVALAAWAGRSR